MKLLKLIPDETSFPFTKYAPHAAVLTVIAFAVSLVALFVTPGINLGVDFRGGITIEVEDQQPIDIANARSVVAGLNLGGSKVQEFGAPNIVLVVVDLTDVDVVAPAEGAPTDGDSAQQRASEQIQAALRQSLGDDIEFRRIDVVGPTVSAELVQRGALAIVAASAMILLYIWIRFQWQWGVGAVIGVVHDTLITVGIYALFRFEFNLATIAAILTVIGYSVNDTVVVYDRIRENLRKYKKMPLRELIDLSLNETLTRTVVTGGTTILALIALVIFGGEVLRGFSIIILLGIVIGTYSSIFVCAPFLLLTGVRREASAQAKAAAQAP